MKRVFHGVCTTGASISAKEVVIHDTDIDNSFSFEEGDLLSVFFGDTNTVDEPTLVIYNGDTESEVSTTIDTGRFVKTRDVEANVAEAWDAGETIIFVFTKSGQSNLFYWEMIEAGRAKTDVWGVTKLFDDDNFASWIQLPERAIDDTIALTPNTLKKFYNSLTSPASSSSDDSDDKSDEPTPVPVIPIGLVWTPSEDVAQYEAQELGILSLSGGTSGVSITYPIQALINEKLGDVGVPTHTGQLTNNGNGPGTKTSDPFITKIVPDDLYFKSGKGLYYQVNNSNVPRVILNDGSNRLALGSDSDNTLQGVYIAKLLTANKGIKVSSGGAAITGNSSVSGSLTISGDGKANILYENNVSLRNKYSPIIEVFSVKDPSNKTIKAKGNISHQPVNMSKSGYTFLGLAGYNLNYAGSNTGDATYCNVWECYKYDATTAWYGIRNLKDAAVTVNMVLWGIYKKNI